MSQTDAPRIRETAAPWGVLWDLDGVLVNTGEFHFLAWQQALAERGIPFDRTTFNRTFGMNNQGIIRDLLGEAATPALIAELADRKETLFRALIRGRVTPLPGVTHWLPRLRELGARQAVASSAPQANIDAILDALALRPYFDVVLSGDRLPGKPDPAVFLEAARRLGLPPHRCIVVEDAVAGVEAARRAGMRCIAVTTTNPAEALRAADLVLDRLDHLPDDGFLHLLYATAQT